MGSQRKIKYKILDDLKSEFYHLKWNSHDNWIKFDNSILLGSIGNTVYNSIYNQEEFYKEVE